MPTLDPAAPAISKEVGIVDRPLIPYETESIQAGELETSDLIIVWVQNLLLTMSP